MKKNTVRVHSDKRPIQRNKSEKERILAGLKADLDAFGPTVSSKVVNSVKERIKKLEEELKK